MSEFTENVLQGQKMYCRSRAGYLRCWECYLLKNDLYCYDFVIFVVHDLTVCCICFSVRQNRASECPAVGVWDVDMPMPRGPLSPTYG